MNPRRELLDLIYGIAIVMAAVAVIALLLQAIPS